MNIRTALVGLGVTAAGANINQTVRPADILPPPFAPEGAFGMNGFAILPNPFLFDQLNDGNKARKERSLSPLPQWSDQTWRHLRNGHLGMLGEMHPDDGFYLEQVHAAASAGFPRDPLRPNRGWNDSLDLLQGISELSQKQGVTLKGSSLTFDDPERLDDMYLITERLERFAFIARQVAAVDEKASHIVVETTLALARKEAAKTGTVSLSLLSQATNILQSLNNEQLVRPIVKHEALLRIHSEMVLSLHAEGLAAPEVFNPSLLRLSALCFDISSRSLQGQDADTEAIALQQDLAPELKRLHAIEPELPRRMVDALVLMRPQTIEGMQEHWSTLRGFTDTLAQHSSVALSHLAQREALPTRSLLAALAELYRYGGVRTFSPLMLHDPLEPEPGFSSVSREVSLARSQDLEKRVLNIVSSIREPSRSEFALIILSGTNTSLQMAEAIDDLYHRGFGILICDGSVVEPATAVKPLLDGSKNSPSIRLLVVVGETEAPSPAVKARPFFDRAKPLPPRFHALQMGPRAQRALTPWDLFKPELRSLLHPQLTIITVIGNDVTNPVRAPQKARDPREPTSVSECIAELTERVVKAAAFVEPSNLVLKVVPTSNGWALQACKRQRISNGAWKIEHLPFGAFTSRRTAPPKILDVPDTPVVFEPNP